MSFNNYPQKVFIIKDLASKPEETDFFLNASMKGTEGPCAPAEMEAELWVIRE